MKKFLNVLFASLVAAAAAAPDHRLLVPVTKQPAPDAQRALDVEFYDYHVFEIDTGKVHRLVSEAGRVDLHLGNQRFDLILEENNLRAIGYRQVLMKEGRAVEVDPGPVTTFKGRVLGVPESAVRLTVTPGLVTGFIRAGEETIYIDPVSDFFPDPGTLKATGALKPQTAPNDVVVYRAKNMRLATNGSCASAPYHAALPLKPAEPFPLLGHEKSHQFRVLQIATDCDTEYYQEFGSGAYSRMEGILNQVEDIYLTEFNLAINIVLQQCWLTYDPYTSFNIDDALDQLESTWNSFFATVNRDVVHQFSDKNFNGNMIGTAYLGSTCDQTAAYGISQNVSGSASRRHLTAHEIGHNLSTDRVHDDESPVCPGVVCNGKGPIMCSAVQGSGSSSADRFSDCSADDIIDSIHGFGCLNPCEGDDTGDVTWVRNGATSLNDTFPVDATFDGANCYVRNVPATDGSPFIYNNNFYVTRGPDGVCEVGFDDGANCRLGWPPDYTRAFIWSSRFYYTER